MAPAVASGPSIFEPAAGSLVGTTVLITGANTGLGLESSKRLYAAGANIIVTARSMQKAQDAVSKVKASYAGSDAGSLVALDLDLADLASVRSFPSRLKTAVGKGDDAPPPIEVLLNNAGVMAIPERLETTNGFERTLGVNHLGHFALVAALMPSLKRAKGGFRIINVSSDAHKLANKDAVESALKADLDPEYSQWGNYAVSKAANVLFTAELQRRFDAAGVAGSAVSLHPGMVQTDLPRYIVGGVAAGDTRLSETAPPPPTSGPGAFLKANLLDKVVLPIDAGANTQVYLAAAADSADGGRARVKGVYYDGMKMVKPADYALDASLAKKLWDVSERLTGAKIEP